MLLLPTLNPPSARRTLRGADFRGISRYITIIIRSIILGDEKGPGREGAGENCSPRSPILPPRRLSRGKLAWLRLGSTQPIFDNSRSLHRDLYPHTGIIPRTYVFYIDLITGSCRLSKLTMTRRDDQQGLVILDKVLYTYRGKMTI